MLMVVERWGLSGMIGQGLPGVTGYQGSGFTVTGHFFSAPFHSATPIIHPEDEQLSALSPGTVLPSELFLYEIASFR